MKRLMGLVLILALLAGCAPGAVTDEMDAPSAATCATTLPAASGETTETMETLPAGTAVSQSLYDRAAELGEHFGVRIRIADQCGSDFRSFRADPLLDEEKITEGLEILERSMSRYPEGFFRQLRWNEVKQLEIQLVGVLRADERYGCGDYSAFVDQAGDTCTLVANVYETRDYTYFHEFSHVIDRKLASDAACRSDSEFSEAAWASFNPEGFAYTEDYSSNPPDFPNRTYYESFLSPYATVSAAEDRALVMEAAMSVPWAFAEAPQLRQKLTYYSACIRDCFDCDGWPEVTAWEEVLSP